MKTKPSDGDDDDGGLDWDDDEFELKDLDLPKMAKEQGPKVADTDDDGDDWLAEQKLQRARK
jgi:hypothetical protein